MFQCKPICNNTVIIWWKPHNCFCVYCSRLANYFLFIRFLGSDNHEEYFTTAQRIRMTCEILQRTVYGKRRRAEIGIDRLVEENVYAAAYPLHDVRSYAFIFLVLCYPSCLGCLTDGICKYECFNSRARVRRAL